MRVLVITHGFPPLAQGGAEIYAHTHARTLQALYGDEVVVLTREQDPNRAEYAVRTEQREGLRVVSVNNTFRNTRRFEETYRNEAIGAIADRVIDELRPDVAHIHHLTCLSTTIVRSLAERRVPSFVTLHDYWFICHRGQLLDVHYHVCDGPEPTGCNRCLGPAGGAGAVGFFGARSLRRLEGIFPSASHVRSVAERAATLLGRSRETEEQARQRLEHMRDVCARVTHFFAPSRHMRDRFVQFGVALDRVTLAPYGFAHGPFREIQRTTSDRLRLGFLGSLMVSKAPHVLLEAASRLPRGSISVELFGSYSPYHGDEGYKRTLDPLLAREGVHVRGAIPHERVAQALASIDVLVVPSIWPENSPLVIQEAFLAGVPVVASRIGGIPEVVADGTNGLLFTPGDSTDLSSKLSRLLDEPRLLDTLRAGLPQVRSIDEDVRFTRGFYETHHLVRPATARPRLAATVLNFRTPDDTLLAVRSLLASRRPIDEIIVVDNDNDLELVSQSSSPPQRTQRTQGKSPNFSLGLDALFGTAPLVAANEALREAVKEGQCTYLPTGRNLGYSGGVNVGIREALARGADLVLLVNSDVIVPPDCVERLEESLDAMPHAGIAGPVVLSRSNPGLVASLGMSYRPATGRMRHRGAGAPIDGHNVAAHGLVDGVSGCLMLVRREVFERIELFDEDYFFSFEDLDFCLRARRAGFVTMLAGLAAVYHEGGRSIGATSAVRLYFAARNHLLMARRSEPSASGLAFLGRTGSIVALNVAHAVFASGGSLPARLGAVARGTRDYFAGRLGAGSEADRLKLSTTKDTKDTKDTGEES